MAITISDTEPRVQYTATSGQTSFAVPFEFFTTADIKVFNGTSQLTFNASPSSASQYSVSGAGVSGGGSITLGGSGATLNDVITIFRDLAIARSTDFPTSGAFQISSLNDELDKIIAMCQQLERDLKFSPKAAATTANTFNITFPNLIANKVLNVNSAGDGLEFGQDITDITTIAGIANDVTTVSGIASNVTTVAGAVTNVNTVASNITNVNTVATNIADVITVANDLTEAVSEIETVASDLQEASPEIDTVATSITNVDAVGTNINSVNTVAAAINNTITVASNIGNVNTVGGISSNVTTVAGISSDVTAVANISTDVQQVENIASNITTVAGISSAVSNVSSISSAVSAVNSNASNINTVAGNNANISTVAGNNSNISTIAGISSNVTTVAGISSEVAAVAGDATDIGTVATDLAGSDNIGTVAGAITNVNNVGGSIANVNTVASNISGVNSFGERYRVSANAPTTSLDVGDLWFDSSNSILKVYGASGFQSAGSSVNGTSERFKYTISGTPTTVSGNDDAGNSLSYDAGFIDVYLNGIKMVNGTDVTVTSGSSVVFASALTNGDVVDIVTFGTFNVANMNASNLTSGTVPDARITGTYTGITGLDLTDNSKIRLGTGNDLEIFHTSTESFIKDSGTGSLFIDTDGTAIQLTSANTAKNMLRAVKDGAVELYHNNSKKFETLATGIYVSGVAELYAFGEPPSTGMLQLQANSTQRQLRFSPPSNNQNGFIDYRGGNLLLKDDGTEVARFQGTTGFLVGTTDITPAQNNANGASIRRSGYASEFTGEGGNALVINRKSNNGSITQFRKDGTTIGQIGSVTNTNFYIGTEDAGFSFRGSIPDIVPADFGANRDNLINLGHHTTRYKDLYLGGGVYLGGTGTANKLDDYEEGTWTPTAHSGITSLSINGSQNTYTKVGRLVTVYCEINGFGGKSSGTLNIGGLPFTPDSNSKYLHGAIDSDGGSLGVARTNSTTGRINFYRSGTTNSSRQVFIGTNLGNGARISLTYFAA